MFHGACKERTYARFVLDRRRIDSVSSESKKDEVMIRTLRAIEVVGNGRRCRSWLQVYVHVAPKNPIGPACLIYEVMIGDIEWNLKTNN
jgi:hypothetical protein